MVERVSVEYLDAAREIVLEAVTGYARSSPGMRECDVRIQGASS